MLLACCHADMKKKKKEGEGREGGREEEKKKKGREGGGRGEKHFSPMMTGLRRQQPRAMTKGHSPKRKENPKPCRHEVADCTVRVTCLSRHAQLLLDGAAVTVKVPVGASHHTLACGLVILHHTLQTNIADVSGSPVT